MHIVEKLQSMMYSKLEYTMHNNWNWIFFFQKTAMCSRNSKNADKFICSMNPGFYFANPVLSLLLQSNIKLINSFCTIKI